MPNGYINKEGNLVLIRAGKPLLQQCARNKRETCNHLCPLFDDTEIDQNILYLCECKTYTVIDER
jgi:hypothetical protein